MKYFILCIILFILFIIIFCSNLGSKTGIYIFRNTTGKRICFVGVAHLGTWGYWCEINNLLSKIQDKILYEGVPEKCGLSEIMIPFWRMAQYTNTIYQDRAIDYEESWILSDITMDEVRKFYSKKQINLLYDQAEIFNFEPIFLSRFLFGLCALYTYYIENDPLVIERNKKPLSDALTANSDVLIFYGQAHYKGIKKGLLQSGYKLICKKYYNIFEL